jgi:hypothetical protein
MSDKVKPKQCSSKNVTDRHDVFIQQYIVRRYAYTE